MDNAEQSLAQAIYDQMAAQYAATVDTRPYNAYYDRPATLGLLPTVAGLHVLDAGCGPGVYSEWLLAHGASVIACDVSAEMVRLARARLGGQVVVRQADLAQPLDWLATAAVDLIVSPLVLDYVADWHATFGEFWRVLRPGGHVVWSVEHPAFYPGVASYFATELIHVHWSSFELDVPRYRRPLQAMIQPALAHGFVLDGIVEPQPTAEFVAQYPESAAKLNREPGFISLRVHKPAA